MSATRILWGQMLLVLFVAFLFIWAATQWTAWCLGFQAQLTELKLGAIIDEKPVRFTVDLHGGVHRDLAAYADVLSKESGQPSEPGKLIAPMLARFMATDKAFARGRGGKG
jgi:hypothetical protein